MYCAEGARQVAMEEQEGIITLTNENGEEVEYNQGIPTIAILPEDVDAHAAEAGISLE